VESIKQILASKKLTKPDEIGAIKDYVRQNYKSACRVKLHRGAFIISVPNSALAATLQLERQKLITACNLGNKKLVIRNSR
jgi:hypothetical protein